MTHYGKDGGEPGELGVSGGEALHGVVDGAGDALPGRVLRRAMRGSERNKTSGKKKEKKSFKTF